jgi:hypothetical protein
VAKNKPNTNENEEKNKGQIKERRPTFHHSLSGKRFKINLGDYNKGKTMAFFINKENEINGGGSLTGMLKTKNLLATDSLELKTIVLIYDGYMFDKLNEKRKKKKQEKVLCFLDMETKVIKKIQRIDWDDSNCIEYYWQFVSIIKNVMAQ